MALPRVYTPKTLVANWYDARKDPSFEGVRPSVQTETQIRAAESVAMPQPTFGASLRSTYAHIKSIEDKFDYNNLVFPDTRYHGGTWASMTSSSHFGRTGGISDDSKEFSGSYRLGGGAFTRDPSALAAYRERWINDTRGGCRGAYAVAQRFQSATRVGVGATAPARFQPPAARPLRGGVKALDALAEKVRAVAGIDAVWRLALALPPDFNRQQLRGVLGRAAANGLSDTGKPAQLLTVDEEKELFRSLAAAHSSGGGGGGADEDSTVRSEDVVAALLGATTGHASGSATNSSSGVVGAAPPLAPERAAAMNRAWAALRSLAALRGELDEQEQLQQHEDEDAVSLAVVADCFDPLFHPDAPPKRGSGTNAQPPIKHNSAAAHAAVLAGVVACLRMAGVAPLPDDFAAPAPASHHSQHHGNASAMQQQQQQLGMSAARAASLANGATVSRSLASPAPLGTSKRVAQEDHVVLEAYGAVGTVGGKHRDPAAGKATLGPANGVSSPGISTNSPFAINYEGTLNAGAATTPRAAAAAASVGATTSGNGKPDHVAEAAAFAAAMTAPLPPSTRVPRAVFDQWATFISAGFGGDDDGFTRFMDGAFHVAPRPAVVASRAAADLGSPGALGETGRIVPDRRRGPATAYSELGSGLAYASRPYDPTSRTPAPPLPVPPSDPDVAASQGGDTSVAVLVRTAGGAAKVVRVPRDRFLPDAPAAANADPAALLRRVRAAGVHDAVSATVDF